MTIQVSKFRSIKGTTKMQEWKNGEQIAGVENAGVENAGVDSRSIATDELSR